jgi:hypothetical protein
MEIYSYYSQMTHIIKYIITQENYLIKIITAYLELKMLEKLTKVNYSL